MASSPGYLLACITVLLLWAGGTRASPLLYNISMEGSGGDTGELELLFPTSFSTRAPADPQVTAATDAPSLGNTITTTMIRLKDFVLSRLVDFLQENMLIIIVVTSLLIVMVFIICCASAMSHKRKLEAYKPPAQPVRKYTADKTAGTKTGKELADRPYAVDHVKTVQIQSAMASPKNLRMPSKALVGEKGREGRSSPPHEVQRAREVEEVERRREDPRAKEQQKKKETQQSSSQPIVCTCHLKKANH